MTLIKIFSQLVHGKQLRLCKITITEHQEFFYEEELLLGFGRNGIDIVHNF